MRPFCRCFSSPKKAASLGIRQIIDTSRFTNGSHFVHNRTSNWILSDKLDRNTCDWVPHSHGPLFFLLKASGYTRCDSGQLRIRTASCIWSCRHQCPSVCLAICSHWVGSLVPGIREKEKRIKQNTTKCY